MPRNRQIKADYWSDEKIGKLSIKARLFFIATWNFADDSGVCRASPMYLKNQIFPYDKTVNVQVLLNECSEQGLIRLLEFNKENYLEIMNFTKHQHINRPSQFRYINDNSMVNHVLHSEDSLTNVKEKGNVNVKGNVKENEALPEWLPKQTWNDYVDMRKKTKSAMTDRAKELAIMKLTKFKEQGYDVVAIINNSIMNSWKGLFLSDEQKRGNTNGSKSGRGNKGNESRTGSKEKDYGQGSEKYTGRKQ